MIEGHAACGGAGSLFESFEFPENRRHVCVHAIRQVDARLDCHDGSFFGTPTPHGCYVYSWRHFREIIDAVDVYREGNP